MAGTLWSTWAPPHALRAARDLRAGIAVGVGVGFGVRIRIGRLNVEAGKTRVREEDHDQQGDDRGRLDVTEAETAGVFGLADVVGEGRPEGPGYDVGEPEGEDLVHPEAEPSDPRDEDDDAKEDRRRQVAQPQCRRGEVPERGAQGERGEDGGPIELFPAAGRDRVDRQRVLAAVPE